MQTQCFAWPSTCLYPSTDEYLAPAWTLLVLFKVEEGKLSSKLRPISTTGWLSWLYSHFHLHGLHNIAYGLHNNAYGLHNIAYGLHNIAYGLHNIPPPGKVYLEANMNLAKLRLFKEDNLNFLGKWKMTSTF